MAHFFLYGPPGSGKSYIGKMLADSLQLPFIDLDQAIEFKTGMSIARIIDECGENDFRDIESQVLREQLDRTESVIALGGGTLLRERNRALVKHNGKVLCLRAEAHILLQRLRNGPDPRPLLAGDLDGRLAALLSARSNHYDSFGQKFDADQPPEQIVQQLQTVIGRFHLGAMGSYDVIVQPGGLRGVGEMLREREITKTLVVTDENVAKFHFEGVLDSLRQSGYEASSLILPEGETSKTLDTISRLWHGFLQAGLDRGSTVIALGGGVIGDLTGFATSTFMRGISWICLPTTLLSIVDASLGGKTGFDLPEGKNLIGSFHAPRLVLADPDTLDTLPDIEFRAGLAEVVKHGIVADPGLFDFCAHGLGHVRQNLPDILRRAVAVKVRIVEADPYEKGERAALNVGHTVGHAIELVSDFGVRHGEAVAMGTVAEARLAERLAIAQSGLSRHIAEALSGLGLPIQIPRELSRPELVRAMAADKKKAGGTIRFALPVEIGRVQVNIDVRDLESVFVED